VKARPSDVAPTPSEVASQLVDGLRAFSVTSHPAAMARMCVYALPRYGLTPAAAILGAGIVWGDLPALIDADGVVTYRQLASATGRLATALSPLIGRRVGLMAEDDRSLLIALGAAGLSGAKIWLLNPRMGTEDLEACLAENHIESVIHSPDCASRLAGFAGAKIQTSSFAGLIAATPPGAMVPHNAKASQFVMMTSGTTSVPVSIPVLRRWASPLPAFALAGATGVRHGRPTLVCAPMFHGYGLSCALLCLISGSPLLVSSVCRAEGMAQMNKGHEARLDWGKAIFDVATRHGVYTIFAVPAQLSSLAKYLATERPQRLPSECVVRILSGADRLDEQTIRILEGRWGPVVANYYGTTESGTVTMIAGVDLAKRPASLGRPVAGARLRIVGDEATVQPCGTLGRIQLASPLASVGPTRGWRAWFTTNDVGWVDADGYLYLEGRVGDVVRMGGEFVSLRRVESVLTGVDGVTWARAGVISDATMGQRVVVDIRCATSVDTSILRDIVRLRLGPAAVPSRISVLT